MNTILKIDEIFLSKLNNAEYTNFMSRTLTEVGTATVEKLGITNGDMIALSDNITKMQDLVAQSRISDDTARLAALSDPRKCKIGNETGLYEPRKGKIGNETGLYEPRKGKIGNKTGLPDLRKGKIGDEIGLSSSPPVYNQLKDKYGDIIKPL